MNITFAQNNQCGVYTVRGSVSKQELIAACKATCVSFEGPHLIWDFTDGNIGDLTRDDFVEIARAAKESIPAGAHRKTAYVGPNDVVFALLCMYSAIAVWEDIPGEFSAFRTMAEAERWLAAKTD